MGEPAWQKRFMSRPVNSLALQAALLLGCLHGAAAAASFTTQWSLGLPWADASTGARVAVFGDDHLVAFTGLDGADWQLVGAAVAGPSAGRVLWTTELPLGSSLPSAVTAAGDLAVVELDGSVFGLHPRNGSVAFIRTAGSLCSLGDPRLVSSKEATDAVYLICNELSGDSSIIALSTMTGATLWSISTSSVAGALVPVRAAAAISGAFLYADTGSNVTALSTVDGALMWRVDVAQLVNSTVAGSSVTHMDVSEGGEVLLLREYAAGLSFTDGPSSYLALELNATGGPPSLLWSAGSREERERLPPGVSEASPIVPPAVSPEDDVFYYWSATAPPPPPPSLPPPAPIPAVAPAPAIAITGGDTAAAGAAIAQTRSGLRLLADKSTTSAVAVGPEASAAPGPAPFAAAPAPAPGTDMPPTNATIILSPEPVPPPVVAPKSEGVGVVAPEGFVPTPVLKARQISTGELLWSLELQPISAPSAAKGGVAVVTPEGLQVLDGATGELRWVVDQKPISIYTYTPILVGGDAAAMHNCLNTLASNSICVYTKRVEAQQREAPAVNSDDGAAVGAATPQVAAAGVSGAVGRPAVVPALVALLCAAAAAFLF